ncbi:MAG: hypothetical protein Q9219_000254 [cf. Caloplaca sp. 3 TL-2023]
MALVQRLLSFIGISTKQKPPPAPLFTIMPSLVADPEPRLQSLYHYKDNAWQQYTQPDPTTVAPLPSSFRLITWNIDFQASGGPLRMAAALRHLEQLTVEETTDVSTPPPFILCLQEMTRGDLALIKAAPWIQARYNLTDTDPSHWRGSGYGTTMLIDRRLPVKSVYRMSYTTNMLRDALFADLLIGSGDDDDDDEEEEESKSILVRICNTHLESLVADPPLRPAQMAIVAEHLHEPAVHAGIVAGDFNAIQEFDRTLHVDNDLKDAYLELGGQEDAEEGYTWGHHVSAEQRNRFGCSRMDKVFYCGGVRVEGLQRIGVGVKLDESERAQIKSWRPPEYVTDHYGLMADFSVDDRY